MKYLLFIIAFACAAPFPPARGKPSSPSQSTRPVTLEDFKLIGDLSGDQAAFTLTATAIVEASDGASLDLVSGNVALTDVGSHGKWKVRAEPNRFVLDFDKRGEYPIQI